MCAIVFTYLGAELATLWNLGGTCANRKRLRFACAMQCALAEGKLGHGECVRIAAGVSPARTDVPTYSQAEQPSCQ
eukprot:scaffold28222_cov89-Phaeocystis_antarctica.AAC.13